VQGKPEDVPVRLQLAPDMQVPVRWMQRYGTLAHPPVVGNYYDIGGKPSWPVEIERVEWRANESRVYIYFVTAVDPDC
jgi:hypothetical protein